MRLRRWWMQRLWRRIAAASAGLLLLVLAAVLWRVERTVPTLVDGLVASDLGTGTRVWDALVEQRSAALGAKLLVLAEDSGLIEAVRLDDAATLKDALDNHGQRIGAHTIAMLTPEQAKSRNGQPLALVGDAAAAQSLQPTVAALVQGLQAKRAASGRHATDTLVASALALVAGEPGLVVVAQQRDAKGSNVLVVGQPFRQDLVEAWRATSPLELAVLVRRPGGADQVRLSTLPPAAHARLRALSAAAPRLDLDGAAYRLVRTAPIDGPSGRMQTVLLREVAEVERPFRDLQRELFFTALAGLAMALLASWYTSRRVTTPLNALAAVAERLGQGEFDAAVPAAQHDDEVGALAQAFDQMRVDIRDKQAEIESLAYIDRLTDLPNRVGLRDAMARLLGRHEAEGGGFAVVLLGLDRFKLINKNLGYAFGDQVLRKVAVRLRRHVMRERDVVARLSGDHFALLLDGAEATRAREVAEGILSAFVQPLLIDEQTVDVSARFGIACWPAHAGADDARLSLDRRAEALVARAEVAMHLAKGKATPTLVYDPGIDASSAQNLNLLSELRRAIARHELRLFLQPKIDIARNTVVGAEALVRWQHPQRGMVPPMEFIPFAEDTGFVRQLTLWIFEETARQWPALRAAGLQRVSVNLSTRDLLDAELPARFDAILRRQGAPATAFCLEITESAVMDEPKRSLAMLDTLSRAGFKLSIDDYGEGQTSLSYLKKLPVDELKIDQIFIKQIDRDDKDAKIVRSTIGLAHSLGFRVVAEGVESAAILALLRELGCDEAQGYHLGRPMPASEMIVFAQRWAAETTTG